MSILRVGPITAAQTLPYVTGIQFDAASGSKTLRPDFFKNFPGQAFEARNMVWDTLMFLSFSQAKFVSVNQTLAFGRNDAMDLAGSGNFTNKNVQLTWSGYGDRKGKRCLLIDYRAFGNPLTVKAGDTDMHGKDCLGSSIADITAQPTQRVQRGR